MDYAPYFRSGDTVKRELDAIRSHVWHVLDCARACSTGLLAADRLRCRMYAEMLIEAADEKAPVRSAAE